jgi:hypothetical protein
MEDLITITLQLVNMIFDRIFVLKCCVQLWTKQKTAALFHFQYFFHCRAEIISPTFYQVNNRD